MTCNLKIIGGAVGANFTGSAFLLIVREGKKSLNILIDAGLVQGGFQKSLERNREIIENLNPKKLDFVLLTHAHIDHSGVLPYLVKEGFKGRIICTDGTANLLDAMLRDSAKIQSSEANHQNARIRTKRLSRSGQERCQPLYDARDVEATEALIKNGGYGYYNWIGLGQKVSVKFYPSGHVIGGAIIVIKIQAKPKDAYLCFTGDLGRKDGIILPPPELIEESVSHLIIESTYGGIVHPNREEEINRLMEMVKEAAKSNKRIIIPSFALERAQEIIYLLSQAMAKRELPHIPIFLDSPLGNKLTSVYAEGWRMGMFSDQGKMTFNPFDPRENPFLRIISDRDDSDALIVQEGTYIVVAGSGMCDAGRVRGHLRANLGKADTIVCLVGYMAENTLGRRLKDGCLVVEMNDEKIIVRAKIESFSGFSAHADGKFLLEYIAAVLALNPDYKKQVFLVHGQNSKAEQLRFMIEKTLRRPLKESTKVSIPKLNEIIALYQ